MPVLRALFLLVATAAVSLLGQTSTPTVSRTIPTQTLAPGGATTAINLADYFAVPGVTGPVVQFDTVLGKINVQLRPDAAPQQVANFLGYVQRGDYANSFIHRSAILDASGQVGVIQGGAYFLQGDAVATIPAQNPVPLEYNLPNQRGTLAAARTSDINSATNSWYFNVRDNSTILGPTNGGGYTVFGEVIGTGMTVVDAIASLTRYSAGSGFNELPLRNYTPPANIVAANFVVVKAISPVPLFADATGNGVVSFTVQNSAPNVATASLTGSVLALTPGASGTATITVHATDSNGNSADTAFTVTVVSTPPTIATQPASFTVAAGDRVVLSGTAVAATSYQWQRNGQDVAGATDATLVIPGVSSANAGSYTLIARNSLGTTTSSAATLTVESLTGADVGRLVNLSIRSSAGTGDQTLIVGFALGGGTGATPLLLRGMGPSLVPLGVADALPDPVATLYHDNAVVATNDNWGGNATVAAQADQVGAFSFVSANSLDAALPVSPSAGSYTMQVNGNGGGTGTALAEIYDANIGAGFSGALPRLVNVSARTQVGSNGNILIAGFVVRGRSAKTVLIRAVGPSLAPLGVTNPLENPILQLFLVGSSTPIASNDDWGGDPNLVNAANSVGAFALANGATKDAAMLVTLPPGNYTAQVSGVNGGTGVALVEVYEVP